MRLRCFICGFAATGKTACRHVGSKHIPEKENGKREAIALVSRFRLRGELGPSTMTSLFSCDGFCATSSCAYACSSSFYAVFLPRACSDSPQSIMELLCSKGIQ